MSAASTNYAKFKKQGIVPDIYIQIDVKNETPEWTTCNMYTGVLCLEVVMRTSDYKELIRKGFFIRDGKTKDGAGILNTTESFIRESDLVPIEKTKVR
jgi:hypothetical protein